MSALTAPMQAALAAERALIFGALEVNLPAGVNVRLLDGASQVTFGGSTFIGRDPTFGVLADLDPPEDGGGDQAPAMSITLHPPSEAAAVSLAAPTMQGSRVRLWLGAIDLVTGAVVADPYLLFDGELDVPRLTAGERSRRLEYECVSAMERLFSNDEGHRLADSFHREIWPGETGLAHVTGLAKLFYWGPGDRPQGGAGSVGSNAGRSGGFVGSALTAATAKREV